MVLDFGTIAIPESRVLAPTSCSLHTHALDRAIESVDDDGGRQDNA